MFWSLPYFPACSHHVFLSHCREDADEIVLPVFNELKTKGIAPWIDRHDYLYGRTSIESLKDSILRSRHTVFFITEAMLTVARGWCVVEYTLSRMLQDTLIRSISFSHVILPIFFVDKNHPLIARSVWRDFVERGVFWNPAGVKEDLAKWATNEVAKFLLHEQKYAEEMRILIQQSPSIARYVDEPGLFERVTSMQPESIIP